MGIGNTTTSSCLLSAVTGVEAEDLVGRGGGLNNEGLETKIRIVREAGERCRDMDPIGKLAAVGGFDLCAMTGCYLGAARNRMPVVIDGFISIVAAVSRWSHTICSPLINPRRWVITPRWNASD